MSCRYVEGRGHLLATHRRDCESPGCEGCASCRDDHCVMPRCSRHLADHEPYVCTKCVGKVRTGLTRIVEMCTLAPIALTEGGTDTAVALLVGPIPERSSYMARHHYVTSGATCRCGFFGQICPDVEPIEGPTCEATCEHITCQRLNGMRVCPDVLAWLDNADDERHPLWVLGTWDMLIAEHLDHKRTLRVTVPTAAAYLASNLTDLARFEDFAFDEMAREIENCKDHVEQVMAVAAYVQKGAPCPKCRDEGRKAKALEHHFADGHQDDAHDEWVCPTKACVKTYTPDEYSKFVYVEYLGNAERLTAEQIAAQYRVPEGTLRRWANGWTDHFGVWREPTVRKHGYDGQRRQLYDVADVKAMRDVSAA